MLKVTMSQAFEILKTNKGLKEVKFDDEYWREALFLSSHQLNQKELDKLYQEKAVAVLASFKVKTQADNCEVNWTPHKQILITSEDVRHFGNLVQDSKEISELELKVFQVSKMENRYLPTPTYTHAHIKGLSIVNSLTSQLSRIGLTGFKYINNKSPWGSTYLSGQETITLGHSYIRCREYNKSGNQKFLKTA